MTKLINILAICMLLTALVSTKVTLFQCIYDGSLCITKSCCQEDIFQQPPFDDERRSESKINSVCCQELNFVNKADFADIFKWNYKILKITHTASLANCPLADDCLAVCYKTVRGPPHNATYVRPVSTPIFMVNCALIC